MKNINVNGKSYPCRITMGAMLRFRNETGRDTSQMKSDDVADLITFIWCCIASASSADHVEFGLSLMDFADLVEPSMLNEFYSMVENKGEEKKTGN